MRRALLFLPARAVWAFSDRAGCRGRQHSSARGKALGARDLGNRAYALAQRQEHAGAAGTSKQAPRGLPPHLTQAGCPSNLSAAISRPTHVPSEKSATRARKNIRHAILRCAHKHRCGRARGRVCVHSCARARACMRSLRRCLKAASPLTQSSTATHSPAAAPPGRPSAPMPPGAHQCTT